MTLQVDLIAWTQFDYEKAYALTGWETDRIGGEALVEFAGRACYQAWDKKNPKTATNKGYLFNLIDHEHGSVLEHATATFYCTGLSRNDTHELIRHRAGTAYSELSQRYVDVLEMQFVGHPTLEGVGPHAEDFLAEVPYDAKRAYSALVADREQAGFKGKKAREAARAILPGGMETKIVVTANLRAWRHIMKMRGSIHADASIRKWAIAIAWELKRKFPHAFQDMHLGRVEGVGDVIYFGEYGPEHYVVYGN